jgi:hypothetical protein
MCLIRESKVDLMSSLIEGEVEEVDSNAGLSIIGNSEHETKVATAKMYPRSIKQFRNNVRELACLDEDTAGSCFYVLPRGGKNIEGPSVRFAEIIAASYGNLQYGSRVVEVQDKVVVAQGVCYDYEKNNSCSIEVRRRITNSNGQRFNEDMIQMAARAACSIALREAIFRVVPRAYWNSILEEAKKTSVGAGKTLTKSRDDCFAAWKKAGATDQQVLTFLDRKGIEDVTIDDLVLLRGLWTAMKDEGFGVDVALRRDDEPAVKKVKSPEVK